jgi:hypothetical protein
MNSNIINEFREIDRKRERQKDRYRKKQRDKQRERQKCKLTFKTISAHLNAKPKTGSPISKEKKNIFPKFKKKKFFVPIIIVITLSSFGISCLLKLGCASLEKMMLSFEYNNVITLPGRYLWPKVITIRRVYFT